MRSQCDRFKLGTQATSLMRVGEVASHIPADAHEADVRLGS